MTRIITCLIGCFICFQCCEEGESKFAALKYRDQLELANAVLPTCEYVDELIYLEINNLFEELIYIPTGIDKSSRCLYYEKVVHYAVGSDGKVKGISVSTGSVVDGARNEIQSKKMEIYALDLRAMRDKIIHDTTIDVSRYEYIYYKAGEASPYTLDFSVYVSSKDQQLHQWMGAGKVEEGETIIIPDIYRGSSE